MAKKETTSKGVIRDLMARAWEKAKEKAKGLASKFRPKKADVEAKERKKIAEKTGRSAKQIADIEKGKRPGRNLLDSLKGLKRGRKVKPPEKEPKKITRGKKPIEKPPTEPPKKPPPQEQPPAAPPSRVEVDFRGYIAVHSGDDESDPVRKRPVHETLTGDLAARFAELWNAGEKMEALELAVGQKFDGIGPGHLESVVGEPVVIFGE